jgi:anti-sigma B factor antagonist
MIDITASQTTVVVTISGDLDLTERDQFAEAIAHVGELPQRLLVVDMCHTALVDSIGASFLISLASSEQQRGGAPVLRGCSELDLRVLEICGALDLFQVDTVHCCPPATASLVVPG